MISNRFLGRGRKHSEEGGIALGEGTTPRQKG